MSMLTRAEYKTLVQHYTGGSVNSSMGSTAALTEVQLIDQAFHFLFDCHTWKWRERGPISLAFIGSNNHIILPADVGEIKDIHTSDGTNDDVEQTTLGHIQELRGSSITTSNYYYVALAHYPADGDTQGAAQPRLEVWPAPNASDSTGLELVYRSRYVPMTADTDVPAIPDWMQLAARHCLRAICLEHEDEDEGAVERFMNGAVLRAAKLRDSRAQWNYGKALNTAMMPRDRGGRLPFNSIADPS